MKFAMIVRIRICGIFRMINVVRLPTAFTELPNYFKPHIRDQTKHSIIGQDRSVMVKLKK